MDNKTYKTSQERRQYQKQYYKVRMDKQKELETKLKLSGGDILAQKINENVDEIIDSDDDYKTEPVHKQKYPYIHLNLKYTLKILNQKLTKNKLLILN